MTLLFQQFYPAFLVWVGFQIRVVNMTSKEELQKHIQLLNEIKSRYPILNDTIKYLEKYQQSLSNPTFDECIKEWEKRGWELFDMYKDSILGTSYYFLEKDMSHRNLKINITYKQIRCSDSNGDAEVLELDELELAVKTLKALEVEE